MSFRSHVVAAIAGAFIGYPITAGLELVVKHLGQLYHAPAALVWQADDRSGETNCSNLEYCGGGVYFLLENSGSDLLQDVSLNFRKPVANIYRDPIVTIAWEKNGSFFQVPNIPAHHVFGILVTGVKKADIAGVWANGSLVPAGTVQLFGQKPGPVKNGLIVFFGVISIMSIFAGAAAMVVAWITHKEIELLK